MDGGSEFKGMFEEFCRRQGIALYTIPLKSPRYTSKVENTSGTLPARCLSRSDMVFDMAEGNEALADLMHRYKDRPSLALAGRDEKQNLRYHTPNKYIRAF